MGLRKVSGGSVSDGNCQWLFRFEHRETTQETIGGGTGGGVHRAPRECDILTLTRWALHGKNEIKSRWCPPPRTLVGAVPSPVHEREQFRINSILE